MNRDGHIISSEFILICILSGILFFLLADFGLGEVATAIVLSILAFLLGCIAPDFDHHAVQKNMHIKWLLEPITKHRGHFHSIVAMLIYGLLIFLPTYFLSIEYWYFPVIFGMLGYLSHLVEDELQKIVEDSHAAHGLKIW
jgi:membrane-bound metal-dependent hydrolase YbcI (DUF457 family)